MRLPFDPTIAACGSCGQTGQPSCDPNTCPSRWDVLTSTADDFLTHNATVARLGVAFYPSLSGASINDPGSGQPSNFCGVASSIDVPLASSDDDAALRDAATAVAPEEPAPKSRGETRRAPAVPPARPAGRRPASAARTSAPG